jgi:hypothetical protein
MKKKWLVNIALLLFSTCLALFLAELALRRMIFSSGPAFASLREASAYAIYVKNENEDFFNEDYWKLVEIFSKRNVNRNPQHLLGWVSFFDKKTLKHNDEEKLNGRRPVLLYGDSFAQCVESVRCFEDILNSDIDFSSGHYLLNYGVGGYGVDQICLLFEETVEKFENPFVVFSLLTTDMDRSMLSFRDAQKPYFQISDGKLELEGVPITLSSQEYVSQNPPEIRSYLLNRFRNSKLNPFKQSPEKTRAYREEILAMNELILARVFNQLKDSGLDYVILIFFPEHHPLSDWRLAFLRDLCDRYEVPYICDLDIRKADTAFATYDPFRYAIKDDGHPTTYMNELIAMDLKRYILEDDYAEIVGKQNDKRRRDLGTLKDLEYYKNQILKSSEWLEQVRSKAEEKGISLDSMIYLDALYMLEKEKALR